MAQEKAVAQSRAAAADRAGDGRCRLRNRRPPEFLPSRLVGNGVIIHAVDEHRPGTTPTTCCFLLHCPGSAAFATGADPAAMRSLHLASIALVELSGAQRVGSGQSQQVARGRSGVGTRRPPPLALCALGKSMSCKLFVANFPYSTTNEELNTPVRPARSGAVGEDRDRSRDRPLAGLRLRRDGLRAGGGQRHPRARRLPARRAQPRRARGRGAARGRVGPAAPAAARAARAARVPTAAAAASVARAVAVASAARVARATTWAARAWRLRPRPARPALRARATELDRAGPPRSPAASGRPARAGGAGSLTVPGVLPT